MHTQSELKVLGETFNQMADNIVANIEKLKNVDTLRRELIANVSHDLRNPLAVIHGYVETLMIRGDQVTKEEQAKYLDIIHESIEKLTQLVADLFDLSKLESGQMALKIEPFKIQELLNDAAIKYKVLAESKNISLSTDISATMPVVQADLYLLDRVIQNLIDNAVKYAPENGTILLKGFFCPNLKKVCVSVRNSGGGIPQQDLDAIFDRYYMVDKEKNRIQGAGLGLAIVRKILEAHQSNISVYSDSESYTEFVFELDPNPYFSLN
jgi:signal transduction histidine kinase